LRGALYSILEALVDLLGNLPPERGPERLSLNVGKLESAAVECDLVDFSTVPAASKRPTNWTMESSVMRASFCR
jgi:hypothetical protein